MGKVIGKREATKTKNKKFEEVYRMKHEIFSILDKKVGHYEKAFLQMNRTEAVRAATVAVNAPDSKLNRFADEYDLYFNGSFDDETGMLRPEKPEFIVNLSSLKEGVKNVNQTPNA